VQEGKAHSRRSLKYIRLAAFLADQPGSVDHLEMSVEEIEDLIGESLPTNARYPSWWRNDDRKMHARAWLTAGWIVEGMNKSAEVVVFTRGRDIQ
jgi:peptidoglycan/xylan/chitin deacetylase (PgdA/CDA1 family)